MIRVILQHHPLTATAGPDMEGRPCPRPLQQILSNAESLTETAHPDPADLIS